MVVTLPMPANAGIFFMNRHLSFRFILHTVKARPRLFMAIALACAVAIFLPEAWVSRTTTRILVAWNVGALTYLVFAVQMCLQSTPESIRRRARVQSESRIITIVLVILAAVAAQAAIAAELATVKDLHGSLKTAHIGLTVLTIFSAWAFTHTMFALHYAHDYYDALAHKRSPGLEFTGTPDPEYGDFLYCAFIIGTSGQTADVSFTNKPMRRLGLVHSVLAFVFNTTLLAMTINMAASFF